MEKKLSTQVDTQKGKQIFALCSVDQKGSYLQSPNRMFSGMCALNRFYARDASVSPPWLAPVWRKSVFALRTSPTRGACQLLSVPPLCQGSGASHGWRVLTCHSWGCVSHLTHSPSPARAFIVQSAALCSACPLPPS